MIIAIAFTAARTIAQNTVGLISYDETHSYLGYTLIYPFQQGNVYLLNNCGQVVHQWDDSLWVPGNSVRLMDDGGIQRLALDPAHSSTIVAGGNGQYVQRKDWDNTVTWTWEYSNANVRAHHDACLLPNGNTLVVAWEKKTSLEAWNAGRDTVGYGYNEVWPDHIVEVQPTGPTTGNIVWEWHAWDHMVQDFNTLAANYGVVSDHPELIDINYDEVNNPDWHHINYIEYNPVLDQIVLSVPHFNELWVIDHSTTTAEAAGHSGGNGGKGGDLLYRWGNPQTYRAGLPTDKKLNFNHGTAWVNKNAQWGDPDFGRIIVFNNRVGTSHSSVDIIDPPVDSLGSYGHVLGTAYGPSTHSWRYTGTPQPSFFSSGLSNAQVLPNGNVLICSGRQGRIFEVDTSGTVVWDYENPIVGGSPISQGTAPPALGNQLFHVARHSADHPGLTGRILDPIGYIELDPDTTVCNFPLALQPNTDHGGVELRYDVDAIVVLGLSGSTRYEVCDMSGRVVERGVLFAQRDAIHFGGKRDGVYLLCIEGHIPMRFAVMH